MRAPTTRAVMSAPDPGPKPTMMRIGRTGKSSARAASPDTAHATAQAIPSAIIGAERRIGGSSLKHSFFCVACNFSEGEPAGPPSPSTRRPRRRARSRPPRDRPPGRGRRATAGAGRCKIWTTQGCPMFVTFFHELKSAGLPVTLREYLTLMEAMQADLASRRVEDFYYLSRAALVKDERNLDKFDR